MSDDLVKRLRDWSEYDEGKINDAREEAADYIEKLAAANLKQSCIKVDDQMRIEKLEEEVGVLFAANVRLNSRADLDSDGYVDRIEKLEDALHTIYKCCDETGNCSVIRRIIRKTLEGKDD